MDYVYLSLKKIVRKLSQTRAIKLWSAEVSAREREAPLPWLKDAKQWLLELRRKFMLKKILPISGWYHFDRRNKKSLCLVKIDQWGKLGNCVNTRANL